MEKKNVARKKRGLRRIQKDPEEKPRSLLAERTESIFVTSMFFITY